MAGRTLDLLVAIASTTMGLLLLALSLLGGSESYGPEGPVLSMALVFMGSIQIVGVLTDDRNPPSVATIPRSFRHGRYGASMLSIGCAMLWFQHEEVLEVAIAAVLVVMGLLITVVSWNAE